MMIGIAEQEKLTEQEWLTEQEGLTDQEGLSVADPDQAFPKDADPDPFVIEKLIRIQFSLWYRPGIFKWKQILIKVMRICNADTGLHISQNIPPRLHGYIVSLRIRLFTFMQIQIRLFNLKHIQM